MENNSPEKSKIRQEKVNADAKVRLTDEAGNPIDLYVLEETKINGMYYLLTSDAEEDEDGECYILKDVSKPENADAVYEFVTGDDELDYVFKIFRELMDDSGVELSE